ncbi:YciI family protein [Conchiformibius kuhniae]|uniref:YciI family protein n=1 Tax=Conchiformibius kuhniae TaxID=211502 RepID=A0ABD8B860_9NEIS|nr:YciI family protein [Conchiformibius kuhniae]
MLYLFLATDNDGSSQARSEARPAHIARLHQLQQQGRLLAAGPTPLPDNNAGEVSGSLIIADFANLDEAEAWIQSDPYVDAGVYAEVMIRPFVKALPDD